MVWNVQFTPEAERDLSQCDKVIAQRILQKLKWLSQNFEYITPLPLKGPWKGKYKLVVGDWRVIYNLDRKNSALWVHLIGHRREIYR
ncbi:MAG: hypothetical protein A2W23_00570 [Planctomycetes bacterium RBG_16_43_13]|nr:MAG: hypothetical protein A2W23_00570 [Planctomycetes bacterium RBG_16_43_13]